MWNTANWRNRRIFDDRAELAAARNVRPYIIQVYARDMGNGITVMMKEIDAPIRVSGKRSGWISIGPQTLRDFVRRAGPAILCAPRPVSGRGPSVIARSSSLARRKAFS